VRGRNGEHNRRACPIDRPSPPHPAVKFSSSFVKFRRVQCSQSQVKCSRVKCSKVSSGQLRSGQVESRQVESSRLHVQPSSLHTASSSPPASPILTSVLLACPLADFHPPSSPPSLILLAREELLSDLARALAPPHGVEVALEKGPVRAHDQKRLALGASECRDRARR